MCTMESGASNWVGRTVTHSVGYLYLMERKKKKILCKGLRHSFCNHFNGQMPPGQEVVAEWTNSAGLVLCGGDPAGQTNVTLRRRICAYTTIHWLHGRGQFSQGISENQAFRHTPPFSDSFSWLWKTCWTKMTSQKGGTSGTTSQIPNDTTGKSG